MPFYYPGTKKRISVSRGAKAESPLSEPSIQEPGADYMKFRNDLIALCDNALSNNLTGEEREKILWLRSRADIEL